jgi:hypothetical protein
MDLYTPKQETTPACRNAFLREAAPAKKGTTVCRHGLAPRVPLVFDHRKMVIGELQRWKKDWMLKILDSGE